MVEEGNELVAIEDIAKTKSVRELMPKMAEENLRRQWGRPKLTEEHFSIIENCLRLDFTITEACDAAWISLSAYYNYYNKDEDFALRMDRAKEFPKMMARTAVMKRIWQWDAKTALRYLELRDKKRYNADPSVSEDEEQREESKVQFISVSSNEWASNTTNPDIQRDIKQSYVSDSSVSSSENTTWWENEEEVLRRLA